MLYTYHPDTLYLGVRVRSYFSKRKGFREPASLGYATLMERALLQELLSIRLAVAVS